MFSQIALPTDHQTVFDRVNALSEAVNVLDDVILLDLNYKGSRDPATDDSANLNTQWTAALAAATTASDGVNVIFGAGTVNLSGLTSPLTAPDNTKVRVTFMPGCKLILGTYYVNGTSTYCDTPRDLFSMWANMEFVSCGELDIVGGGFMKMPSAYTGSNLANYGVTFNKIVLPDVLNAKDSRSGAFVALEQSALSIETTAREVHLLVNTLVTGDGSTTTSVVLKNDDNTTGSNTGNTVAVDILKIAAGDRIAIECVAAGDGSRRMWEGKAASTNGTNTVTFTQPVPSGVVLPVGARAEKICTPAWTVKYLKAGDITWEFQASNSSTARRVFQGCDTAHAAFEHVEIGRIDVKGGQHFAICFGSAHDMPEYFQKSLTIKHMISRQFVHSNTSSGGYLVALGWQSVKIGGYTFIDPISLNETDITLNAAASAQNYIRVSDTLTALTKKAGFSVVSGEADTWSLSAGSLDTATATTTSASAAISATSITVTSATGFATGNTIRITDGTNTRYYGITVSGTTFTLQEALDVAFASGVTVTKMGSTLSAGDVNGNSSTVQLRIHEDSKVFPEGEISYYSIVAVDTSRGAGQHRIYLSTPLAGSAPSGRVCQLIDQNALPSNGDEMIYFKAHDVDIAAGHSDGWPGYQGIIACKGGEYTKSILRTNSNTGSKTNIVGGSFCFSKGKYGPVEATKRGIGIWIQQTSTRLQGLKFEKASQCAGTHNGTNLRDILVQDIQADNQTTGSGAIPAFQIYNPGGGNFKWSDCSINFHPYLKQMRDPYSVQLSNNTGTWATKANFEDIILENCRSDTFNHSNEANMIGNCANIYLDNQNNTMAGLYAIKGVYIDGDLGRSSRFSAIKLGTGGRVGKVRLGPNFSMKGFSITTSDLIMIGTSASSTNTNTVPSRLTDVTTASAASGALSIQISATNGVNLFAGMHIQITLDSTAVHSTFIAKDTGTDGVIQLVDALPSAAASGNAISIRPLGGIDVDRTAAKGFGYAYEKLVSLASGVSSLTLSTAGIFPCFRHSPGAPQAQNVFCQPLTGDRDRVEILIDNPVITANSTSQSGGSIVWNFKNPTTPASAKNLTQTTLFRVGWYEPTIRFNQ